MVKVTSGPLQTAWAEAIVWRRAAESSNTSSSPSPSTFFLATSRGCSSLGMATGGLEGEVGREVGPAGSAVTSDTTTDPEEEMGNKPPSEMRRCTASI